jgi:hypothetical protein
MTTSARTQIEAIERGLFAALLLGLAALWLGVAARYLAAPEAEMHARVPSQAENAR